jgi:hypothetical protein
MESSILLPVSENQVIALVQQLTPKSKRTLLRNLISEMDALDRLMEYGSQRIRAMCDDRGIDWDTLSEEERMRWLDVIVHESHHA